MARADEDLQKHTLNLYRGDYEKLMNLYPDIGAGAIVRRVVRKFIEQIEAGDDGFSPEVKVTI